MAGTKNGRNKKERERLAQELGETWSDNEEHMGEMAAFSVSCSQLGIDEDEGWALLAEFPQGMEDANA